MNRLRFSCHSWLLPELPLDAAARQARSLGFDWFDIAVGPHLDLDEAVARPAETGRRIRKTLREAGLGLSDAFPVLLYPALNGPRAAERRAQLRPLAACLAEAGSPGFSVSPGLCQDDGFATSWARSVDALHELVRVCREYGLTPRVELHFDSVANTPSRAHRLLADVPGLSLLFNPAHWEMQATPYDGVRSLIGYASHVKLRPACPGKIATDREHGTLDLARVLRDLVAAGYAGTVCLDSAPAERGQNEHVWAASFEGRSVDPQHEVVQLRALAEQIVRS